MIAPGLGEAITLSYDGSTTRTITHSGLSVVVDSLDMPPTGEASQEWNERFPEFTNPDQVLTPDDLELIQSRLEWYEWLRLVESVHGVTRYRISHDVRLMQFCSKPVIPLYFYPSGYTFHRPVDCRKWTCDVCAFKHHVHPIIKFLNENFYPTNKLYTGHIAVKHKAPLRQQIARLGKGAVSRFVLTQSDGGLYVIANKLLSGQRWCLEHETVADIVDALNNFEAVNFRRLTQTGYQIPPRWTGSDDRERPIFARRNAEDKYDRVMEELGLADDAFYQGTKEECELIAKLLAADTGFEVVMYNGLEL